MTTEIIEMADKRWIKQLLSRTFSGKEIARLTRHSGAFPY